tara:strand:- start:10161 stop:11882 length:1722 start_codon:yes stop_codon:yes gene_type:complete
MTHVVKILKRDYSSIKLEPINTNPVTNEYISDEPIDILLTNTDSTILKHFFHDDIVIYTSNNNIELIDRKISHNIPGVLELYSKYKFKTNTRGVPAYLFIPLQRQLPKFLVHTKIKKTHAKNQLITIKFNKWSDKDIFPTGELVRIIGDFDDINSIELALLFKYMIYPNKNKRFLNISNITNRSGEYTDYLKNTRDTINDTIMSIDPVNCKDIDDAFSLSTVKNIVTIKIHIADVYTFLEYHTLTDTVMNYSSIYLTNTILHMISSKLSTNYCSLLQKTLRPMITLIIKFNTITKHSSFKFKKTYGKITKNYNYDNYPKYIKYYYGHLEQIYRKETSNTTIIKDSHSFIEVLMILYNFKFTQYLQTHSEHVIFRGQKSKSVSAATLAPTGELGKFLNIISSNSANYTLTNNLHTSLNLYNYTHSTSPIRRIVDLINQGLYHKNSTLFNGFNIEAINSHSKILKKFYRDVNKLKLATELYATGEKKIKLYIYKLRDTYIEIYIPEYKINISYALYNYKLEDMYIIQYDDITKTIRLLNNTDNSYSELKLFVPMIKTISGNPDIHNIDKSLIIEL